MTGEIRDISAKMHDALQQISLQCIFFATFLRLQSSNEDYVFIGRAISKASLDFKPRIAMDG
jgi:hypothetical protein